MTEHHEAITESFSIGQDPEWYKRAVFYEVLIRGFQDSTGDGTGDLRGLTSKLDYLEWLGIDCIWLLPIYSSPLRDGGYDISDFLQVLPEYGNIADFVTRWGAAYPQMVVLDADSLMTADAIVRLAATMEADPDAGIVQSLPLIVNRNTLFARVQQFAARVAGPVIAAGLTLWMGRDGNYWGHNAIIRTRAFADHCGMPDLPGRAEALAWVRSEQRETALFSPWGEDPIGTVPWRVILRL